MSGSTAMVVGDKGRVVIPAWVRQREGWTKGTTLVLVDTDEGILVTTYDELRERVRRSLAGPSLVDELIAERRAAAAEEDEV